MGYIAASLVGKGHKVRIYNAEVSKSDEEVRPENIENLLDAHSDYVRALEQVDNPIWQEVGATLAEFQPEMVGITVKTAKYGSACRVSSLCKQYNQSCYVIWGGPHPTIQPQEVMANSSVDFVVRGEGERTIIELVQALEDRKKDFGHIAGLSFRRDGQVIHNRTRELIEELDELPYPAKDLILYPERYSASNLSDTVTSRGCPYNCGYCGAKNLWTRRIRFRSVPDVLNELRQLQNEYGIGRFHFSDDSFTVNRRRTMELCQEMISQRIQLAWGCTTRLDLIDDELLTTMSKAGCVSLSIGIESGSQRILDLIKKDICLHDVLPRLRLIMKRIFICYAYFMVGFPHETREDVERTIELMEEVGALGVQIIFSIFTPYPGTELFDLLRERGMLLATPDWNLFSHQSPENYFCRDIPKEEFAMLVQRMAEITDRINGEQSAQSRWRYFALRRHYFLRDPSQLARTGLRFLARIGWRR